jgi:hypothetical protein
LPPPPFEPEVEAVVAQARMGASDRWKGLLSAAVDVAVDSRQSGSGWGDSMMQAADALAQFPEHLPQVFSDEKLLRVLLRRDTASRARSIYQRLRRRAQDALEGERKEARKEARDGK